MNFKDAYKSYNDEIKGKPDILDAIFNEKKKNKFQIFLKPAFTCAVAAMFVVVISVLWVKNFDGGKDVSNKTYIASTKSGEDKAITNPDTIEQANKSQVTNPQDTPSVASVADEDKNTLPSVSAETASQTESLYTEEITQPEEIPAAEPATDEDAFVDGPAARMADDTSAYSQSEISAEEYFKLIGINMLEDALLPSDMTFDAEYSVTGVTDETTGDLDHGSFTASARSADNAQRFLSISVAKNDYPADDFEIFYGETTDVVTGAKSIKGDIAVVVDSANVTEAEIISLINSLN